MSLEDFIKNIEDLVKNGKPNQIIQHIKNLPEFLISLKALESMIGMKDLKLNIVSQIKYYLLNKVRNVEGLDSQMFHTVLLGPPGSGKTTAAELLADIWMNLGVLKPEPPKPIIDSWNEDRTPLIDPERLKVIQAEKEKLKKSIDIFTREAFDSKVKLAAIKTELFIEKEKIDTIHKYLGQAKTSIDAKLYTTLDNSINSLDTGVEYIIKKYIGMEKQIIPEANAIENDLDPDDYITSSSGIETPKINNISKFIKLRRDDLIGKYIGHTAIKTRDALMNGLGKVIFIDEAYELYNVTSDSSSDSFGMECLSAILNFMNEFSDRSIIIFAGYEDLLKRTIFRVQPGLERRIAWTFTLNPYNEQELVQIYEKQLKEKSWILEDKDKILNLFKNNKDHFKHGGGDTLRLATYTKTVYSDVCFEKLLLNMEITSVISFDIVSKAIQVLKENVNSQKLNSGKPPEGMYC